MLVTLAILGQAFAGTVDLAGFGAQNMGRGGGGIALVDGPEGLFLDPAGLHRMPKARAGAGYMLLRTDLEPFPPLYWDTNQDGVVDETDEPLDAGPDYDRADGILLALGRPVGGRFGLGLAAFVPVDRLLRIQTFDPEIPSYFMLQNRLQRYEAVVGFGWEQVPGLSVGGAVEVIARARYDITITLDVGVHGATDEDQQLGELVDTLEMDVHEMTLDLVPGFAPIASVMWEVGEAVPALDGLVLAAVYRGDSGLPVDIEVDLQANVSAEDLGDLEPMIFSVIVPLQLQFVDHYVPERVSLGAAWSFRDTLSAYVDVHRTSWDKMKINVAEVTGGDLQTQVLQLDDPTVQDGNGYYVLLRPVWSVRVGTELWLPQWNPGGDVGTLRLAVRGGWGYDPTPLVEQGPNSAFLDSDRMLYAVGVGVEHGDPFGLIRGPVTWDAFLQRHVLAAGTLRVPASDEPRAGAPVDGASIPIGGQIWAAGIQWSIEY